MKNFYLSILISSGLCFSGYSQSSIDASGGHAKSSSYSFSYSLGEVATLTLKSLNGNNIATSGVIQPDPILIIDVQNDYQNNQILYPNPVNHILHFYPGYTSDIKYIIYKYDGLFISSSKLISNSIDVRELTPGLYYIKLINVKSNFKQLFQFVKS